ncbi:putative RNA-binding Zn ribbon-like protein [Nocardiopsis mwathae]|uniref:Putative RNA-binding Zn ribbon-like protein n=1 Tax=Nocardiopsis mwathae TaxID=1472723 RepID=A0A7W9YGH1_9ACTN|nr:CGNR zinc finger domain-containing protein [Nocardiopsis mwathae]MBB6171688.1 putative RNA-binding Zn ribbon-like protein [Nocardiopsis mwathae]
MPYSRPAAPGALERIETFCNSARFLYSEDAFTDPGTASAWLRDHGWPVDADGLDEAALGELVRVREAIRHHLEGGADSDTRSARRLLTTRARTALLPPRWDSGGEAHIPAADAVTPTAALIGALLATLATEELAGRRSRLKVCASPECRWVFYDRSPGDNSVWCAMDICGARHKMRAYRGRRSSG